MWYAGKPSFDEKSMGIYSAMVFLAGSTITHVLASMSANLGIVPEKMFRIAMKTEFAFDVFVPTQLGKHYYAIKTIQEGNVYAEPEYEIKGAQMRNANVPRALIEGAEEMMKDIIQTVMAGKKISLREYLGRVADVERHVINNIRQGGLTYLRNSSIKDSGSYAGEKEDSPYQHHFMWNQVFGPKYGEIADPPYKTKKLSLTLSNPTRLKEWLDSMEDKELAQRMRAYMKTNEKYQLNTIYIPIDILLAKGIPPEVEQVMDYEKIVADLCGAYYIILETLGYYSMGEKVVRLVSQSGY
jgi:hypothetical protein